MSRRESRPRLLLLDELLHIIPVHFAYVNGAVGINGYCRRVGEPLNLLQDLAIFRAGNQQAVVRGFLSGALKKKMGLRVDSTKRDDGERTYRVTK